MSEGLTQLAGHELAAWRLLENGVTDPQSPARTVAFATHASTGGGAVRMVVLRAVDKDRRTLTFFTHRRSGKMKDLLTCPNAEIVVWDQTAQFQVRVRGTVNIRDGTKEVWEKFGSGTQLNYANDPAPGEPISEPDDRSSEPDRAMFVVLTLNAATVETLWLGGDVHRRARFENDLGCWLAP